MVSSLGVRGLGCDKQLLGFGVRTFGLEEGRLSTARRLDTTISRA